ncbi:hypothetical protein CEXT_192801 [Caerostris extrusa]|uniref:Uncharacterized protein n=1 Tax=Caerostris extrusa TaxID=172846 RepID=A0AAV4XWD2_CAEEX|nr:hypothetical protein CEXT_192801 [Caerostris extrusa]
MDGFLVGNVLQQKVPGLYLGDNRQQSFHDLFFSSRISTQAEDELSPAHVILHSKGLLGRILLLVIILFKTLFLLGKTLLLKLNCIGAEAQEEEDLVKCERPPKNIHQILI